MNRFAFLITFFILNISSVLGQKAIQVNGRYALLGANNTTLVSDFDSIVEDKETFDDPFFWFYKNGKQRVVFQKNFSKVEWSSFTCLFDEIRHAACNSTTATSFIVRNEDSYGVIDQNGAFVVPMIYDTIYQPIKNAHILVIKSGQKYDFIDIILDIATPKKLTLAYDEVYYDGTVKHGYFNLRAGNKYGCYYWGMNGNHYIRGTIEPKYDKVLDPVGKFVSTTLSGVQQYLYLSSRLNYSGPPELADLLFGEETVFTEIESGKSCVHKGSPQVLATMIVCDHLYIDYTNPEGIPCYNLNTLEYVPMFNDEVESAVFERILLTNPSQYYKDSEHVLLMRVKVYEGFQAVERIYELCPPKLIYTVPLENTETIQLVQNERNWEFVDINVVQSYANDNYQTKKPKTVAYLQTPYMTVNKQKPPKPDQPSSGGGGGGKWMDFLFMGGR